MAVIRDFLSKNIPQVPKVEIGIGGFTALAIVSESVTMSGEAPTTWLEDGSFASDHIVLNPLRITIEGEASDINLRREPLNERITRIQAEIGNVSPYLPTMTQSQIQIANSLISDAGDIYREIDKAIDDGKQLSDFIGNNEVDVTSIREAFIDKLEGWHYGRELVSISTELRLYENMWLSEIVVDRDNGDNALKFKISAQEVRFATVEYSDTNDYFKNPADGLGGKADDLAGKGPQVPESVNVKSLAKTLQDAVYDTFKIFTR